MLSGWLKSLVGLGEAESVAYVQWRLLNPWPRLMLIALLLAAVGYAAWSYARRRGQRPGARVLLGALRLGAIGLVLLIVFQPELALQYTSIVNDRVLLLIDRSQSMSIRDVGPPTGEAAGSGPAGPNDTARLEAALRALLDERGALIDALGRRHAVSVFAFAEQTVPLSADEPDKIATLSVQGGATDLAAALRFAADRHSGENIGGVVLLSDMASNRGEDPASLAGELGARGIAVYPVPWGDAQPPDVRIETVHAKPRAFLGEQVPVKVQVLASPRMAGRETDLTLSLDGADVARRSIRLSEGLEAYELAFVAPTAAGRRELNVAVAEMEDEVSTDNNQITRPLELIDERIKVLYVEGAPRWEYRYLRWVLLRDPRLDVKFLMTQGDPELAAHSPQFLSGLPTRGREQFDFDLIILGDVPAAYFRREHMVWVRTQIERRGAALLMIAGPVGAPCSFADTPLAELLPVRIEGSRWRGVSEQVRPLPTEEGLASRIAAVGDSARDTQNLWGQLAPLYDLPPVGAKPGATVLVTVPVQTGDGLPFPLVAWQRFGSGKTMFVGTEHLWRLRRKVGRLFHERFWSTTIQFLTLSRLLGGNRRVTLECDRQRYAVGQPVQIFADVLDEYLEPVERDEYVVSVSREQGEGESTEVKLRPTPGIAGFYRGWFVPREEGTYRVEAAGQDRDSANQPVFQVESISVEMQDPSTRIGVAEQLAQASGGQVVPPSRLARLPEILEKKQSAVVREATIRLWDHPLVYVLLIAAAGSEWFLRRRRGML